MDIFSTVFVLILCGATAALAFIAHQRADECAEVELRIEKALVRAQALGARVTSLEGAFDSLRLQHQKLAGKFHAAQREMPPYEPAEAPAPPPQPEPHGGNPYCDNYRLAQEQGPLSEAARCECGYCLNLRAARERFRADAVPKTARGQAELARLNASKP